MISFKVNYQLKVNNHSLSKAYPTVQQFYTNFPWRAKAGGLITFLNIKTHISMLLSGNDSIRGSCDTTKLFSLPDLFHLEVRKRTRIDIN